MTTPKGLYRRANSGNWYFRLEYMGTEHRRSTKTPNLAEAKAVRDAYIRQLRASFGQPTPLSQTWGDRCREALENPKSWLHKFKWCTQRRNAKFGIKRGINTKDLYRLALQTNGICAVSAIPFEFNGHDPVAGPFAISIDRIRSGEPYARDNCRFVLRGVNYAMHTWGEDAFWQIAKSAVAQRLLIE